VSTPSEDPDTPYLPERYRQQVKAKKQRKLYKKIGMVGIVFILCAAIYLIMSGMLISSPQSPPQLPTAPAVNSTTTVPTVIATVAAPDFTKGTGISILSTPDMISLDSATIFLRLDYPKEMYTIISANLTDRYSGYTVYEFTIQPVDHSSPGTVFSVFEDAISGEPYTPGQENARITPEKAKDVARSAVPFDQPDQVRVRYQVSPDSGRTWNFVFVKGTAPVLTGSMDSETGIVSSFNRIIKMPGRPTGPVLDISAAQEIANTYISEHNGPVAVNMSTGRYNPKGSPSDPVAGYYSFEYNRIVNDIPCDNDGFVIGVDSVTGEITGYKRQWNAPDNAFSVATEPLVVKHEATFVVLQKAEETFPASVNGLQIVSAEIRWNDQHKVGVTPRLGSIPLAWKVEFDDETIRANSSAKPALAWVDIQSGKILEFQYRH